MELYTIHPIHFNIITQTSNLQKSELYCDKDFFAFKKAYNYLFKRLNTKKIIWCYGAMENCFGSMDKPCRVWQLEVPTKYVTAIHSDIWDFVINNWRYCSDELFNEVSAYTDNDSDKATLLIDKMFKNTKKTYHGLIRDLKDARLDIDQFLIPSPVKARWVKRTYIIEQENKPFKKL